jgi:hypothetical protein
VHLKPDATYVCWINSTNSITFEDTTGYPAVPYLLIFHTSATPEAESSSTNLINQSN